MRMKSKIYKLMTMALILSFYNFSFGQGTVNGEKNADGSIKKWHRIEVVLDGPNLSESPATFRNYRLDVTFTSPSNQVFRVPGFFDGDDDPANTGANSGNKWKARFTTGEEGTWNYSVSFVTGTDVAANLTGGSGGTAPDGESGSFTVGAQDKSGKDFRAKGKLQYVGEHYLQFANGESFIKCGANSPEVLMADRDFDGNPNVSNSTGNVDHSFQESEFNTGDPTWKNNLGRGIIGVVNYLSGVGVNSHYFLSMNILGDGKHTFPFVDQNSPYTYDLSKLGQWELVFSQFDKMGLMIQFQTQETENNQFFEDLEGGVGRTQFSIARRLYYRELVARFGHHLAITWNLGEESNASQSGSQAQNTPAQRRAFAERIEDLTYYNDNISIHNGNAGQDRAIDLYQTGGLLGNTSFTGTSLQLFFSRDTHDDVRFWYDQSQAAGKKWVIAYDEPFANNTEDIGTLRKGVVWSTLMAGGQMEWYIGGGDLNTRLDYTDFAAQYTTLGRAANFMNDNLSREIHKMTPNDNLIENDNYAFAEEGETYLFYLIDGGNATVDLSAGSGSTFTVQYFNPSNGDLVSRPNVSGGSSNTNLGNPPNNTNSDWVILLKSTDPSSNLPPEVSFNLPEQGTALSAPASVIVNVAASDSDGSVASVDLFLDNVLVRTEGQAPYDWNDDDQDPALSNLTNGTYTLRAVATDNDGATTSVERTFTVENSTDPTGNSTGNLALNGAASQSSTAFGGVASRAIDGNTNGNFDGQSVTHTTTEANAWWEVDLGITENIGDIIIYNRTDSCCANRLTNFTVSVVSANGSISFSESFNTSPNPAITVNAEGAEGRIVRVQLNEDNTALSLAEVEVFAGEVSENEPPVVSFTLPTQGTTLTAQASVIVNVTASDPDGSVASVGLFLDNVLVRTEGRAPFDWNDDDQDPALSNLTDGTYTLRAVATDNDGATTSVERTFTVENSTDPTGNPTGNLALNGSASQSSTAFGGVASRAIDGNTNGTFNDDSVTHTNSEANAWWEVDLGVTENIGDIIIYNRTDICCANRLTNFTVSVVSANGSISFSESFNSPPNPSLTLNANGALGRIVRVQLNEDNTPLSLAEVEVFAGEGTGSIPPVVSFTLPTSGTTLSSPGSLEVDVAASDPNGSIDTVDLFLDDAFVRTEGVNPYLWNNSGQDDELSNLPSGTYTLRAVATDNEGNTSSVERTFTVGSSVPSGNLALTGAASQSSTAFNGVASRAIDGNTDGNYNDDSVTHTNSEANAWWEVDLGTTYPIGDINIFNRTNNCCVDRLTNFTVSVVSANGTTTFSQSFNSVPNPSITVNAGGALGTIVRVELNENNTPLSLAEVEVFGFGSTNVSAYVPIVSDTYSFPNPFDNTLTVEVDDDLEIYSVQILGTSGNLINTPATIEGNEARFSTEMLGTGLYFVRLSTSQGVIFQKVIKE